MSDEIKLGSTYRICETCGAEVEGMFKCKCDLSKPREFWISPYEDEPEDELDILFGEALLSHPRQGPTQHLIIHVIEYSAYEAVCKELHELRTMADSEGCVHCHRADKDRDKLKAELEAWRNDSIVAERDELRAKLEIRNQPHQIMPDGTVRPVWQYQEIEKLQSELAEQQKLHERTRELRNQEIDKLRADLDKYRLDADKRYCDVEDENDKLRAENKSIIENYNQVEVEKLRFEIAGWRHALEEQDKEMNNFKAELEEAKRRLFEGADEIEKLRSDLAICVEALEEIHNYGNGLWTDRAKEALAKLKGEE